MLEWRGWRLDEEARRLEAPVAAPLSPPLAAVLAALIRAQGRAVSRQELAGALEGVSRGEHLENLVGTTVSRLNRRLGPGFAVKNVRGVGYRVGAVVGAEDGRRRRIEEILVDQFEATGPHARMAAKMIAEVYS